MRWFFVLIWLWPSLALAATGPSTEIEVPVAASGSSAPTMWSTSDKDPGIRLSNGNLTASGSGASSVKGVRATKAKWISGKWCYQFTVDMAGANFMIGLAAPDWPLGRSTLGTDDLGQPGLALPGASAGIDGSGTIRWWNNKVKGDAPATGKTGMVCADLDQKPPAFWVTSDITGTTGHNGGPRWNGGNTADPVGSLEGSPFWMGFGGPAARARGNGCCIFPISQGTVGSVVTANFGSFTPPAGYTIWDGAENPAPVPGPMDPQTINVANAPPWQQSYNYALKDRVVAGPAWNGAAYTNGQDLCLFAVKIGGNSGSSQASLNRACSSGTPANYGGGQNGDIPAQWNGATSVSDGGVTWVLLAKVDYNSLTGAFADDTAIWQPNHSQYGAFTWLLKGNDAYRSTYDSAGCTTGLAGPGPGNINTSPALDGTCKWEWAGSITYSSKANIWPHMIAYPPLASPNLEQSFYWDTYIKIWWGGGQRPEYVCGQNNESVPILSINHTFQEGDVGYSGYHVGGLIGIPYLKGWNGFADLQYFRSYLLPPPGDSFRDNVVPSLDPLRYDAAKGSAIYCPARVPTINLSPGGAWINPLAALSLTDGWNTVDSLQVKAEHDTTLGFGSGYLLAQNNILDSAHTHVVENVASSLLRNNLIVSRSTDPNCFGIEAKYRIALVNNTIVSNGCKVALITFASEGINQWGAAPGYTPNGGPAFYGNLILGFRWPHAVNDPGFRGVGHPLYWDTAQDPFISSGNATDTTDFSRGNVFDPPATDVFHYNEPWYTQSFGGFGDTCGPSNTAPCTGLSAAAQLVNPTPGPLFDARLKTTADVKGAGSQISARITPPTAVPGAFASVFAAEPAMTAPPIDILKTPRSSAIDIGAYQVPR